MATESKLFNIGSQSGLKKNGSMLSNMEYNIPEFIKNDNDNIKAIYISVKNCELPNSFYLINNYNNKLTLEKTSTGDIIEYILENGLYNINTFITALQDLLGNEFLVSFNNKTQKITIKSVYEYMIIISKTTMNRFLGIPDDIGDIIFNNDPTNTQYEFNWTSIYTVNFLPLQKIHFRSSSIRIDSYNAFDKSNDIFLSIQNNAVVNGSIQYNNLTNLRYLCDAKELSVIDLRITDDKNRNIDFNGVNWYLTFQIDYEYFNVPTKNSLRIFLNDNKFKEDYLKSLSEK